MEVVSDRIGSVSSEVFLTPPYGLSTVSIPLLAHDLKWNAPGLLREHPIVVYERAASQSYVWSTEEERTLGPALEALRLKQPPEVEKFFRRNRYAEILYRDYRCCAIHGLDLGPKTMEWLMEGNPPVYRNFMWPDEDDDTPVEQRCRTRIMFPLGYLAEMLTAMIESEDREAADAGWRIPYNATLTDELDDRR